MTPPRPSLRSRLARHVLLPLVLATALGTVLAAAIAEHFAAQAFDRSLLDDAYALASHVRTDGDRLSIALTEREIGTLLFDQSESMYFAVLSASGELVAGHAGLPSASVTRTGDAEFTDVSFDGKLLRAVTLRRAEPQPHTIVVGQTTASRNRLLQRLLLLSALPQVLVLGGLAWWLRRRLREDLEPLALLNEAIARRDANDLAPLPAALKESSTREVERIAAAIDGLLGRVQEGLDSQREFAGTVAHELRTPLAAIRGQASLALGSGDPAVWRAELEAIAGSERRASRLVDQLLALARAAEGSAGLQLEDVALNEVAREVLLRFLPRADAAGADLGGEGLDETITVRTDRALVEGLLSNLLDNALRYGVPAPGAHITVAVHSTAQGVELSVCDEGPGLAPGQLAPLRRRWVQGEAGQRLGQGAGLGLSIVARYADLLGTRVEFGAGPGGRGLRAAVRWPREGAT